MATTRPKIVVTTAFDTPCVSFAALSTGLRSELTRLNASKMPRTVPRRPTSGAIAAMSASQSTDEYTRSAMRAPSAAGSFAARIRDSASDTNASDRCDSRR